MNKKNVNKPKPSDSPKIGKMILIIRLIYCSYWPSPIFIALSDLVLNIFKAKRDSIGDILWRDKTGIHLKRYREEAQVIASYLKQNRIISLIKLELGNQNYDAFMVSARGASYLEVTSAIDGHLQSKINLHVTTYGRAPLTLSNREEFTKNRFFETEVFADVVLKDDEIERSAKLVEKTLRDKLLKKYPKNCILLIAADTTHDIHSLDEYFDQASRNCSFHQPAFKEVWLVHPYAKKIKLISKISV